MDKITLDLEPQSSGGRILKNFDSDINLRITSLQNILDEYNFAFDAVLKIDCEECEYETILYTSKKILQKLDTHIN